MLAGVLRGIRSKAVRGALRPHSAQGSTMRVRSTASLRSGFVFVFLLAACGEGTPAPGESARAVRGSQAQQLPPFNFTIRTLSNRADLISDGDALVEVSVPKTVPMKKVTLLLNGANVSAGFVADEH